MNESYGPGARPGNPPHCRGRPFARANVHAISFVPDCGALSQIKECVNKPRFTSLRDKPGRTAMLVQIDSNPRLAAIWHFGELVCVPVAVVLTLTALMI